MAEAPIVVPPAAMPDAVSSLVQSPEPIEVASAPLSPSRSQQIADELLRRPRPVTPATRFPEFETPSRVTPPAASAPVASPPLAVEVAAPPASAARVMRSELVTEELAKQVRQHPKLSVLEEGHLHNVIATAADRKSKTSIGTGLSIDDIVLTLESIDERAGQVKPVDPKRIEALQAQIRENIAAEKSRGLTRNYSRLDAEPAANIIEHNVGRWKNLATQDKVSLGLGCILVAMTTLTSVHQLSHAVETGPDGQRHVNAPHLLMGSASALLAIGMACITHAQYKGAVAAH